MDQFIAPTITQRVCISTHTIRHTNGIFTQPMLSHTLVVLPASKGLLKGLVGLADVGLRLSKALTRVRFSSQPMLFPCHSSRAFSRTLSPWKKICPISKAKEHHEVVELHSLSSCDWHSLCCCEHTKSWAAAIPASWQASEQQTQHCLHIDR